jgi:molecular chaperone HscB
MKLDDDDFVLFGLPQSFRIDPAELDRRWRDLQSKVHPDRFAADGGAAQRLAMQWAMRVNQAHRRLKNPVDRAAYLCTLAGTPVDAAGNSAMPAAFLVQQMAWREALDDADDAAALDRLDAVVAADQSRRLAALETALDVSRDHAAAAAEVRALMFLSKFRDDLRRRQEAFEQ